MNSFKNGAVFSYAYLKRLIDARQFIFLEVNGPLKEHLVYAASSYSGNELTRAGDLTQLSIYQMEAKMSPLNISEVYEA